MILRLLEGENFCDLIQRISDITLELVSDVKIEEEMTKLQSWLESDRVWCDFSLNSPLTAENVIKSTFSNEERLKFIMRPGIPGVCNFNLAQGEEYFLTKISRELGSAIKKFNSASVMLHNTASIKNDLVSEEN